MSAPSAKPHILILGGGLGGLTLAQVLRNKGITFEVFERDKGPQHRRQGWAIALHSMMDDFLNLMPSDLPSFSVVNHLAPLTLVPEIAMYTPESSVKLGGRDDGTGKFVRADRQRLRDWLSTNIPIQYDKHGIRIEENQDSITVHFQDGSSATGDILVGAEGVHSSARKYLLKGRHDPLEVHRTATITGELHLQKEAFAEQLALAHSSYILDFNSGNQRYHLFVGLDKVSPDGRSGDYYWHLMWPDAGVDQKDHFTQTSDRDALLQYALKTTQNLPRQFRSVVEKTDIEHIHLPTLRFYTLLIDSLPTGRVTLLGDAAHAMTPFRGEGGCHAMQDAFNFARALDSMEAGDLESIKKIMGEYQHEMLERGGQAARLSSTQFANNIDQSTRVVAGRPIEVLPKEEIII